MYWELGSSWNPIKLRNETILKEVTDCVKVADEFLTGDLNLISGPDFFLQSWGFAQNQMWISIDASASLL